MLWALPILVRPWLVGIGTALVIIGIGTLVFLLTIPPTSQTSITTFELTVPAHNGESLPLWMQNTSDGTLSLNWNSSSFPVTVTLYHPTGCAQLPDCPSGGAIATWTAKTGGQWSTTGSISFPYLLNISNDGVNAVPFHAGFTESFTVHSSLIPPVTELLVYAGGAILIVIGALGVFLGLFLRAGVYRGPAQIPSRSAEDVERLYPLDPPSQRDEPR